MSKLDRFIGKPIKKVIDGEEYDVCGLDYKDLVPVMGLANPDDTVRANAIKEIARIGIKKSIPDATDEEINNLKISPLLSWFTAIMEASGLEIDRKKLDEMTVSLTQTT